MPYACGGLSGRPVANPDASKPMGLKQKLVI